MKRAITALAIGAGLLGLTGCSNGSPLPSVSPPTTSAPSTYHYVAPVTTSYAPPPIGKGDFTIGLKTVSKQCFGSAGCNLVVEPSITYAGSTGQLDAYGTCNITYTVTGDESGDVIETAYGQGGTQFAVNRSVLSTKSSKVAPSASVTDVSCS